MKILMIANNEKILYCEYYLLAVLSGKFSSQPPTSRKKKFNVPNFHPISSEYLYTFKLAMKEIKSEKGAYYTKPDIPCVNKKLVLCI